MLTDHKNFVPQLKNRIQPQGVNFQKLIKTAKVKNLQ